MKKREREVLDQLMKLYFYVEPRLTDTSEKVRVGILYTEIRDELKEFFNE